MKIYKRFYLIYTSWLVRAILSKVSCGVEFEFKTILSTLSDALENPTYVASKPEAIKLPNGLLVRALRKEQVLKLQSNRNDSVFLCPY